MRSFQLIKVLVCPEDTALVFLEETVLANLRYDIGPPYRGSEHRGTQPHAGSERTPGEA